ncbi:hypothetical protein N0V82_007725 [Gnomoniopsis sp. IMI 355080]|nr:hypothetical protein N0V82_007725 [Gnomoniopsis sp. IMI 355080]
MASSQIPISYAAAASALDPAQLLNQKEDIKDGTVDNVLTQKDEVSTVSDLFNMMEFKATKPLAEANVDMPDQATRIDHLSSLIPTSASASEYGNESRLSFISQTSSNDVSAIENDPKHASIKKKASSAHPVLSIWTGVTSNCKAPAGFNALASLGSASGQPLSPPIFSARKSRFAEFFPAAGDVDGGASTPESPFFPDGLQGGLVTAMSDIKVQRRRLGEDVKSYVDAQYASHPATVVPQPGTKGWNEYIASLQAAVDAMPMTFSNNPADLSQMPAIRVGHKERSSLTGDLILPTYKADGDETTKSTPTVHNPRAPPFIPRRTATIQNLEQVAEVFEEQKSLTVTRPRSSWIRMPNWRSRENRQNGMWRPTSTFGRGDKPRDTQSQSTGPQIAQSSSRVILPPFSQALTTTQSTSSAPGAIGKRDKTRRTFEPFRPMNAVLNPDAYKQPLSEKDIAWRVENGVSLNYHGNHENPRNLSAKIPDDQNCAVWITNLPSECTTKDLLQTLMHHRPGRVWATVINAPEEPRHRHAAAKIVFYHPIEARRLLNIARKPGIFLEGRRISVIYNKQRVAEQQYTEPTSRAIEIRGDKAIVNEKFLRSLFENHFKFEDEAVEVLAEFSDARVMEWRFGSMRAQASSAYKLLQRMYPCVHIRYATDPCAQYLVMPGQKQFDQLLAPVPEDGSVPYSNLSTPGGSGAMS